jgi:hypothetical protein
VGAEAVFYFGAPWDGLVKTAVFRQGEKKLTVANIGKTTVIPWEVLQEPGVPVDIGVYGINSNGTVVIPTVWAKTQPVRRGVDLNGDPASSYTPEVWEQVLSQIGDLSKLQTAEKENLVGAINEASRAVCLVKVDETGTADKTVREIGEGYRARKLLLCLDESKAMLLPFVASEDGYRFGAVVANTEHWVLIGESGVTRGSTDLVTVSGSLPNPYRLNFIGAVEAEYDGSADVAVELPSRVSQLENDAGYLTQAPVTSVNGQTGSVEITLPQSLPNPKKLSVTGIASGEYDGSEAVTLEIPGVLYVKITGTGDALASEVSHTQIQQAYNDGRTVACLYSNVVLSLLRSSSSHSVFGAVYNRSIYTVTVRATGTVTVTVTPVGSSGSVDLTGYATEEYVDNAVAGISQSRELLVQVTQDGPNLMADKTCKDILNAHLAGQEVRCTFIAMSLPLVRAAEDSCVFSCVYNGQVFVITITADNSVTATVDKIDNGSAPVEAVNSPTLLPGIGWRGQTDHMSVSEVRFVENYQPDAYDEIWDAGVEAGAITAYRQGNVITVSANGSPKIKLSENCVSMFAYFLELVSVNGLDMLDASDVTILGGIFAECRKLISVDLSSWNCGKLTKCGGMFNHCYELRYVKMPNGLSADTQLVTTSMFEGCYNLVEVDMGNGPTNIGDKMFAQCHRLERVIGLSAATSIGARAFIYCANLKDIDIDPAVLTEIGESAFRLSSVEDCINMDDLNPDCVIGTDATRSKRWSDNQILGQIQSELLPIILLPVPGADSQKRYPDVKFGYKNVPWDDTQDAVDVYISEGGCSALTLYHEWQCIYGGTDKEKANFLDYWKDFEGDNFVNQNTDDMPDYFRVQAEMLGWTHEEILVTGADQLGILVKRLKEHKPTAIIMPSANNETGYHAVLIVGADNISGKFAILDPGAENDQAILSWVKFEDIFADDSNYDRLVIHTYGDAYEGYEPTEYIPVPDTAAVGQTIVVKAVDENGKPTEWEAVNFPIGGSEWKLIGEVETTEELSSVRITSDTVLNEMIAYVSVPPLTDTGGTTYVRPVLKNKGAINAYVLLNKGSTTAQRELWHIARNWGVRQYWKAGAASAGVLGGLAEDLILNIQNDYANGGGVIGFDITWNQDNKFPAGVVMKVWGR